MRRLVIEAKTGAVEVRIENDNSPWMWFVEFKKVMTPEGFDEWWHWMSNPLDVKEVLRDLVES